MNKVAPLHATLLDIIANYIKKLIPVQQSSGPSWSILLKPISYLWFYKKIISMVILWIRGVQSATRGPLCVAHRPTSRWDFIWQIYVFLNE